MSLEAIKRRKRHEKERGAALVEAAIVFFPLCIILFGIIEYGFIFKDSLTISSATRSGARTGSALASESDIYTRTVAAVQVASTAAKFKVNDELWVYKADTDGTSQGAGDPCTTNCRRYRWNGTAFAYQSGDWSIATHNACSGVMDSFGVRLQLSHDAITGVFSNLGLSERTVMNFEPKTDC